MGIYNLALCRGQENITVGESWSFWCDREGLPRKMIWCDTCWWVLYFLWFILKEPEISLAMEFCIHYSPFFTC
jgi:hypothetical protein